MKIKKTWFNEEQIKMLASIGIEIDEEKDYSEEQEFSLYEKITDKLCSADRDVSDARKPNDELFNIANKWRELFYLYQKKTA